MDRRMPYCAVRWSPRCLVPPSGSTRPTATTTCACRKPWRSARTSLSLVGQRRVGAVLLEELLERLLGAVVEFHADTVPRQRLIAHLLVDRPRHASGDADAGVAFLDRDL